MCRTSAASGVTTAVAAAAAPEAAPGSTLIGCCSSSRRGPLEAAAAAAASVGSSRSATSSGAVSLPWSSVTAASACTRTSLPTTPTSIAPTAASRVNHAAGKYSRRWGSSASASAMSASPSRAAGDCHDASHALPGSGSRGDAGSSGLTRRWRRSLSLLPGMPHTARVEVALKRRRHLHDGEPHRLVLRLTRRSPRRRTARAAA